MNAEFCSNILEKFTMAEACEILDEAINRAMIHYAKLSRDGLANGGNDYTFRVEYEYGKIVRDRRSKVRLSDPFPFKPVIVLDEIRARIEALRPILTEEHSNAILAEVNEKYVDVEEPQIA